MNWNKYEGKNEEEEEKEKDLITIINSIRNNMNRMIDLSDVLPDWLCYPPVSSPVFLLLSRTRSVIQQSY